MHATRIDIAQLDTPVSLRAPLAPAIPSRQVPLADAMLVRRLRCGDPRAVEDLWAAHANTMWSLFRAMCDTREEAMSLLQAARLELPREVRGWHLDTPVSVQLAVYLWQLCDDVLELGTLRPMATPAADSVRVPTAERARAILDRAEPATRLAWLLGQLLGVKADELAAGTGVSSTRIREARRCVAMSLMAAS